MAKKSTSKLDRLKQIFLLVFVGVGALLIVVSTVQAFTVEDTAATLDGAGALSVDVNATPTAEPSPTPTLAPGVELTPTPTVDYYSMEG